jgi:hypothetical protein
VTPIDLSYYGTYRCMATNIHGKDERAIELRDARAPGPLLLPSRTLFSHGPLLLVIYCIALAISFFSVIFKLKNERNLKLVNKTPTPPGPPPNQVENPFPDQTDILSPPPSRGINTPLSIVLTIFLLQIIESLEIPVKDLASGFLTPMGTALQSLNIFLIVLRGCLVLALVYLNIDELRNRPLIKFIAKLLFLFFAFSNVILTIRLSLGRYAGAFYIN